MFKKGSKKPPNSGRRKGTPNKSTQTLSQMCEEMSFDPFKAMLTLAKEGDKDMLKEVCTYLYPKRKAIEHSVDPATLEAAEQVEQMSEKEKIKVLEEELKRLKGE